MQTQPEETATSKSVFSGEPKSAQRMDPKPLIQKQSIEQIRRRAFDLYSDNRYKEAAPLLDQDCNSGDAYACETLGYMYEIELGVPADKSRATFLYAKTVSIYSDACDAGSAKSCESLNGLYEDREIIGQPHIDKHELPSKIKLFTKACDAGSSDGCFYLGNMYDSGEKVVQDQARATMLFSKSCNGNMAWSCGRLGDNYLKGTGISKDLTKAKEFLTKGCALGAQWACDEMKKVDQP
jgi:TPR repeat protein